jgi:hypothetical protein
MESIPGFLKRLLIRALVWLLSAVEWNGIDGRMCWPAGHRAHTERQWPLSGVHSTVMVNSLQADGGRGVARLPLSFYLPSRTKLWCTLQLRGEIHSLYFSSTPICTLWVWQHRENWRQPNNLMMASLTFLNVQLYNTFVQPFNFRKLYINRIKCKLRIYYLFTKTEL